MIHAGRLPSLGALLADAFHTFPGDDAVVEVDRDRELARFTYAEVRARRERVARWWVEHGLTPGGRVGIVASNQHRWLVSAAGILHAGGVIVPLDARLTAGELAALLRHARVHGLVVDHHVWRQLRAEGLDVAEVVVLPDVGRPLPTDLDATPFDALYDTLTPQPLVPRERDDVACIVYSSGTGGDPKGCQLTHGNYLAQYDALAETFAWRRGDRYLSILPTNHAIDFMCGFLAAWATGCTVVHPRTLRPEFIVRTMRRYRVTQLSVVPLVLRAFRRSLREKLDEAPPERRRLLDGLKAVNAAVTARGPRHGVSRWLLKPVHDAFGGQLRTIFCGGAYTEPDLVQFFDDLGLSVAVGYGLTEACTVVTVNDLKPVRADTVGAAVPGVRIRIADPGPDGVGEVQVHGPTVFAGYLDDPEQTAASFTEDGWLRTGDLGWIDGSLHLHLVGRAKNLVVTPGGKNVYPEDLEGFFADVPCDELVVAAEDFVWPRRGLSGERLIGLVRTTDRAAARRALADRNRRLADFKRLAGVVWWDEAFPRTASLKVKRGPLAEAVRDALDRDAVEAL